jgi:hypothetical protein
MEQNKNVDTNIIPRSNLSIDKKNFSKTNFNFGNYSNMFQTNAHLDYSPKTPEINNINKILHNNPNSKTHSFKMGDHMVDYISDNKLRFYNPNVVKKIK